MSYYAMSQYNSESRALPFSTFEPRRKIAIDPMRLSATGISKAMPSGKSHFTARLYMLLCSCSQVTGALLKTWN